MSKFTICVSQVIEIELDEDKFNEEFMEEFRENFYPFYYLEDHAKYIAQLYARGLYMGDADEFVEGYGYMTEEFGVYVKQLDQWEHVEAIDGMEL